MRPSMNSFFWVGTIDDKYVICEKPIALIDVITELKAGVQLECNDMGIVHELLLNISDIATAIANELQLLKLDFHKFVGARLR